MDQKEKKSEELVKTVAAMPINLSNTDKELNILSQHDLKQITYKGVTHLYNYAHNTDCGIAVPFQGKHLKSESMVNQMTNITCKKCLDTIAVIHLKVTG